MKKVLIAVILAAMLAGCAGPSYVKKQVSDRWTKTETICSRKTYIIPFYVVVAAGFFTFQGAEVCEDVVTKY